MDDKHESYIDALSLSDEDRRRLSRMLMLSRAESGISQEKVALELGVAKKTVQNWERGISTPTLPQAIAWFRVMKVAAMPYFLQFMFPDIEGIKSHSPDEQVKEGLLAILEALPMDGVRQLMYLFYGNHGSSPRAVVNMLTAYLQMPLKDRYIVDNMILSGYKVAQETGTLARPEHIRPDIALMERAAEKEFEAIGNNKNSYMLI